MVLDGARSLDKALQPNQGVRDDAGAKWAMERARLKGEMSRVGTEIDELGGRLKTLEKRADEIQERLYEKCPAKPIMFSCRMEPFINGGKEYLTTKTAKIYFPNDEIRIKVDAGAGKFVRYSNPTMIESFSNSLLNTGLVDQRGQAESSPELHPQVSPLYDKARRGIQEAREVIKKALLARAEKAAYLAQAENAENA